MTKKRDTTQPQPIGERLVVRVAPETRDIGLGLRLRMFRLTHPHGRQRLAGTTNFISHESARRFRKYDAPQDMRYARSAAEESWLTAQLSASPAWRRRALDPATARAADLTGAVTA